MRKLSAFSLNLFAPFAKSFALFAFKTVSFNRKDRKEDAKNAKGFKLNVES